MQSLTRFFFIATLLASPVISCKCVNPPTVENSLNDEDNTDVFRVRVKHEIRPNDVGDNYRYYAARVKRVFKGTMRAGSERVIIKSATHSCGEIFEDETVYLLFVSKQEEQAKKGLDTFTVKACDSNKMYSEVTEDEKEILDVHRKGHVHLNEKDKNSFPTN